MPDPSPLPPAVAAAAIPAERDRTQEICALIIANGYLRADEFRELMFDEALRTRVTQRLDSVGLRLVHNVYSEHWGVVLNDATAADERLEWSNNFGLERGAMALLLILWTKLVFPKRLAQEERQPEDGTAAALFPGIEKMPQPRSSVSRDQIVAEFGELLGGVTLTQKYIAQLARARLIKTHGGVLQEGPLLALVVDETRLADDLRREVLLSVLRKEQATRQAPDVTPAIDPMSAPVYAPEPAPAVPPPPAVSDAAVADAADAAEDADDSTDDPDESPT